MQFYKWLEKKKKQQSQLIETSDSFAPASAEVQRTGLQPQVDSEEIQTTQKDYFDKLMAIDSQIQRLQTIINQFDNDSSKLNDLRKQVQTIINNWNKYKENENIHYKQDQGLNNFFPSQRQVQWMQDNQPLPEDPRVVMGASPGSF